VIVVAVQGVFRLEMHKNKLFLFFKISTSKQSENITKIILSKKKLNFEGTLFAPRSQTHHK
jgi:hypothetical protein